MIIFDKHEMYVGIILLFLQWQCLLVLLLRVIIAALVVLLLKSMKFPLNQKNPSRNGKNEKRTPKLVSFLPEDCDCCQ